jgi:MoxR-like ATPase
VTVNNHPIPAKRPDTAALISGLRENIARVFLGHRTSIDRVVCALLARGHVLIEDVPGVGKTVLATALARSVDCTFSRIQLTPDMLPSDVLGVSVYDRNTGEFIFKPGPIFANIVLADEINRTPPRTQTALLEAMSDGSVSMDGRTMKLDEPFMVVATQNPSEFDGTYLLPENQLDRFLMRISLGYPTPADEARVLDLRPASTSLPDLTPVLHKTDVVNLQKKTDDVRVDRSLLEYIVEFANATRRHDRFRVGLSPRGSLALAQAARATALFSGRDYTVPEDITSNIAEVCAHRVIPRTSFSAQSEPVREILTDILRTVASPA